MLTIREEIPEDIKAIDNLNEAAFGQRMEADIVQKIRGNGNIALSLAALQDGQVVGHLLVTPMTLEPPRPSLKIGILGPLAVLPQFQRQGFGARLMQAGIAACRELGYDALFLFGHPEYYPRFGFTPATDKGFREEFGAPPEAFMVLELRDGALHDTEGTVRLLPEFSEAAQNQ